MLDRNDVLPMYPVQHGARVALAGAHLAQVVVDVLPAGPVGQRGAGALVGRDPNERLDRGIAPPGRHACSPPCTQGSPAKPGSALGYRLVRPKAGEKRDAGSALACQPARRASRGVPWCAARFGGQAHGMGNDSGGGASRIDVARPARWGDGTSGRRGIEFNLSLEMAQETQARHGHHYH